MADTPEKGNSANFEKWVYITTLVGKFFLTFSATSYVLGVLIANIYFGQLGDATISLFKTNYIFTGTWALAILLFSCVVVCGFVELITSKLRSNKNKVQGCLALLVAIAVLLFVFNNMLTKFLNIQITFIWLLVLFMSISTNVLLVFIFYLIWKVYSEPRIQISYKLVFAGFMIFGLIAMVPCNIVCFAEYIYPSIPSFIGGASPIQVQVFIDIDSEINSGFKKCGLSSEGNGVWGGKLLLATDSEYLFTATANDVNGVLCVRKQDVKAIKYCP